MMHRLGIDVGSTTAKVVLLDPDHRLVYRSYRRHNARVLETLLEMLAEARAVHGDSPLLTAITGTAGMGLAERSALGFVQEVVAAALVVQKMYPAVRTLIDIGGEDGKIILFDELEGHPGTLRPTIRMNGNCAGGTGAFIDQMATLLGVGVEELSGLSETSTQVHPMASRCGVFAKTDVQTLMSRSVPRQDIVASVYRAVAFQTVSSLAHGADLVPMVLFAGGPLGFQPGLRRAFRDVLGIREEDTLVPENPELLPATGAALDARGTPLSLPDLMARLESGAGLKLNLTPTLPPLFESPAAFADWTARKESRKAPRTTPEAHAARRDGRELFLGIDSGSRTSKMVLIDREGCLVASFYRGNDGDPLETVIAGLSGFAAALSSAGIDPGCVASSASTGYGEELLHHAFRLDHGVVETLAHFRAAREWDPEVSFILDIGGQDMKAIFVEDRVIRHMDLNEACSSGTGSFIEGFALNLGKDLGEFALSACGAAAPRDLGSRCTVFMNSKVKQALREGAGTDDISAGLAYSVIRNCFQKVLKIHDPATLGGHVVAQGGTFRNPAVLRALELQVGQEVVRPDIAELMGAYGAAMIARDRWQEAPASSSFIGFAALDNARPRDRKNLVCTGCENKCQVTRLDFGAKDRFVTGHKCEKVFRNAGGAISAGAATHVPFNMMEAKRALLFDRPLRDDSLPALGPDGILRPSSESPRRLRIGLPRILNFYEDFPFWCTLFVQAGCEVVISDQSTFALAEPGYSSVMSENVCFPAKIAHGHILNLCAKQVDRIFHPMVRHDREEFPGALNSFNCPVVTGYSEVIRSAINPREKFGIPYDCPPVSFRHPELMGKACVEYLGTLGVPAPVARKAWEAAEKAWQDYRITLRDQGRSARERARSEGRLGILMLSRPYHADPLINHKVPEMVTALGADIYTDDLLGPEDHGNLDGVEVLTQWAFPNRFYDAALWAAGEEGVEVVHLNSFGCGPDALTVDEVKSLLRSRGKNPTLLRIDEVSSPGSLRLRVRSLLESIRHRPAGYQARPEARTTTPLFQESDRVRTILAPTFSPFYTDFIVEGFRQQGYKVVVLPMPDWKSVQAGLACTNHDICYPATIVIGDLVKALTSGEYDPDTCAVAITQTGGQCRASSYASLLKKALVSSGMGQVPVVTLSTGSGASAKLNEQPGFRIGAIRMGLNGLFGILYADCLAKMFYAASVREKEKGLAWKTVEEWLARGVQTMSAKGPHRLMGLLGEAVQAFNRVLDHTRPLPKVGVVGEIYVKFNPFANNYLTDWLAARQIEADVPPLVNFFLQKLVTDDFNQASHIDPKKPLMARVLDIGEGIIGHLMHRANRALESFAVPVTPFHTMGHLAEGAQKTLSLINQYGESWLIAGDISAFSEAGTDHVVCLQPFGCIANHVIAKGVEKRLKETFPRLSLLFLDMDAGSSEVNLTNRLEFLARSAWGDFRDRTGLSSPGSIPRTETVTTD